VRLARWRVAGRNHRRQSVGPPSATAVRFDNRLLVRVRVCIGDRRRSCGAVDCSFVNWRFLRSGRKEPRRVVVIELMLAAVIVLATAVLTETEHP